MKLLIGIACAFGTMLSIVELPRFQHEAAPPTAPWAPPPPDTCCEKGNPPKCYQCAAAPSGPTDFARNPLEPRPCSTKMT